jgi:hypothetical protein
MVVLAALVETEAQGAGSGGQIEARHPLVDGGVVVLERGTVVAVLAIAAATDERAPRSDRAFQGDVSAMVLGREEAVHGTAEVVGNRIVSGGRVDLRRHAGAPSPTPTSCEKRSFANVLLAGREVRFQPRHLRARADDLDDSRERGAPVEVRRPAPQHLDPVDRRAGNPAPVDPPAERIVQGDAVLQDERAAGAAAGEAAHRRALGGGVGPAARRPPEQGEAGHLAQRVVEALACRRLEIGRGQHEHARRGVAQRFRPAGRGHRHPVLERRRGQDQIDGRITHGSRTAACARTRGLHGDGDELRPLPLHREPSLGVGGGACGITSPLDGHGRVRHGRPRRVAHVPSKRAGVAAAMEAAKSRRGDHAHRLCFGLEGRPPCPGQRFSLRSGPP